ncbi:uncharacterized protein ACBR49_005454 [Aulostomus maculatus]
MMRLLFLCLLLLLPAATALSEEAEGSAIDGMDDEDLYDKTDTRRKSDTDSLMDKAKGSEGSTGNSLLIIIITGVTVMTLLAGAIVAVILVRRRMHNRQQGIYGVPTEQNQKGAV